MNGESPTDADRVVLWGITSEIAGDRRRCPYRLLADDGSHRSGSVEAPSPSTGPDDSYLSRRLVAGDETALDALYDRHAARVYALALVILQNRGAAERVLHDAFLRLWARPTPVGPAVSLLEHLLGLARDLSLAEARRNRATGRPDPGDETGSAASGGGSDHSRPDRIARAISSLPSDQRRAIELAYFAGLSERTIAELMGINVLQTRRLLRLGFAGLRAHLARQSPDEAPAAEDRSPPYTLPDQDGAESPL